MQRKKDQKVNVIRNSENPEPLEIIAQSIIEISNGFKKLASSKIKPRVLYLLIKDLTGLPIGTIEKVLNAIPELEKQFIKK